MLEQRLLSKTERLHSLKLNSLNIDEITVLFFDI